MFSGLIETVGSVASVSAVPDGQRLTIDSSLEGLVVGESIAVSGVCLTATTVEGGRFTADVGPETLRVTTLGALRVGGRVNLERALRADSRLGGHFVQGHVDGLGAVVRAWPEGEARWFTLSVPPGAAGYLIPKGAVAVDGVSLTVAALDATEFSVMIVPFTWAHTTLSAIQVGDQVNLEYDMVGKYVVRAVERMGHTGQR
jgi:riboflavin synthase